MPTDALPEDLDADGKRTARSYLGRSLRSLSTVAGMDPEEVGEGVGPGTRETSTTL